MRKWNFAAIAVPFLIVCFATLSAANPLSDPAERREIRVTARRFEVSPTTISVSKGEHVRLVVTSEDEDFDLSIRELEINRRIHAKQPNVIDLRPDLEGSFALSCVRAGDRQPAAAPGLPVTDAAAERVSNMKVTFDHATPGVVIVESGGERIKIDTATNTVERITELVSATSQQPRKEPQPQLTKQRESSRVYEPYDYHVVNIPTPKRVRRNSLNLYFTHRFQEQITAFENEGRDEHIARISKDLLGLDSFAVSSFGLTYGITDRLYANVYRSPLCQQGLCKTIELGLGYHFLDEAGKSPIALSAYASVEGDHNFTERYTWNFQAMLARSVTKYVNVFFSPAAHVNSNGGDRFKEFISSEPLATKLRLGQHSGSFGFGVNAQIRPTTSLLFEFTPRVGFKMGQIAADFDPDTGQLVGFRNESEAEIGFGIEKRIGRHVFSLTFSNTQTTTTARYNSSNLGLSQDKFTIGFNLFRRLR
ncbi:MAG TPA: DUF5777 family beta-barrel protein [Blastocatellia bacterium]|nr:DUF5777 family beta-barrel protein [Blastocatellia bacterium]